VYGRAARTGIIGRMGRVIFLAPSEPRPPKPAWLKVRAPGSPGYLRLKHLMRELQLHTVCEDARCPNIGECWHHGTATFMILGDVCTRACAYCAVAHGRPGAVDADEPVRVADAIATLALKYVVVTSVDRDDLPDGGASIFARTIRETRARIADCRIEVLIPDFQGNEAALHAVLDARPDVLNHNTETVPRLYRHVRPGARFERSLELLHRAKAAGLLTKSGIMVGLGETDEEILQVMADMRAHDIDMITIGQYLAPSGHHLPVARYVHPDTFKMFENKAIEMGFSHAAVGAMVRSSYHADKQAEHAGLDMGPAN
jgi:lipoyl synthase